MEISKVKVGLAYKECLLSWKVTKQIFQDYAQVCSDDDGWEQEENYKYCTWIYRK